ncbi:DNA mismatch repair endonuclease MutL [Acetobacteraceae bacterium]|nr:DNA mismatch repair endonuclease MutL [Acetobacteraceae bacterium]
MLPEQQDLGENLSASTIHRLPDHLVNLIAAGEVVERPAGVVKELVENALDAGATSIEIETKAGGKDLIEITDDGRGMSPEELPFAVKRHCTSKLKIPTSFSEDLLNHSHEADFSTILEDIRTLGFRGEALPSIASTACLSIISRLPEASEAWIQEVKGGEIAPLRPVAGAQGTKVRVSDLFFATPARRKFLKSTRVEDSRIENMVRRLALCAPHVSFRLKRDNREVFYFPAQPAGDRAAAVMGAPASTFIPCQSHRGQLSVTAWLGSPSQTRSTGYSQFFLVNGRSVTDKVLQMALRVAYRPLIERGRFPIAVVHLQLPYEEVDVNVHPTKNELRFRDEGKVRGFLIHALSEALSGGAGVTTSFAFDKKALQKAAFPLNKTSDFAQDKNALNHRLMSALSPEMEKASFAPASQAMPSRLNETQALAVRLLEEAKVTEIDEKKYPLGEPITQIFETYILARAPNGALILVDQHAAHERLTIEKLRDQFLEGGIRSQTLLMPEILEIGEMLAKTLLEKSAELEKLGFIIEDFGAGSLMVRGTPSLLGSGAVESLLRDMAEELTFLDDFPAKKAKALEEKIEDILATMACHGSIRAGRRLNHAEMSQLLRDMETNPRAGNCPHGRPTWVSLGKEDLEKIFGRT